MKNFMLITIRNGLMAGLSVLICSTISAQQHVIADKDNTRPETKASTEKPVFIRSLVAKKWNGYNEIQWVATHDENTRKFIVEYSTNGIDFQSAGEKLVSNNQDYLLRHQIFEERPMLYRIRAEKLSGKSFYTSAFLLDGVPIAPVKIYPTVITTNSIRMNAHWPVERINIYSSSGQQVFSKDVGGQRDFMEVAIPNLAKGMYYMNFYGVGWKSTDKFVVQ